jgi:hypothetical protein
MQWSNSYEGTHWFYTLEVICCEESQLINVAQLNHTQQVIKKRVGVIGNIAITIFGGISYLTNNVMSYNKSFLKTLCFIFARVTRPFPLVKTFGSKS